MYLSDTQLILVGVFVGIIALTAFLKLYKSMWVHDLLAWIISIFTR